SDCDAVWPGAGVLDIRQRKSGVSLAWQIGSEQLPLVFQGRSARGADRESSIAAEQDRNVLRRGYDTWRVISSKANDFVSANPILRIQTHEQRGVIIRRAGGVAVGEGWRRHVSIEDNGGRAGVEVEDFKVMIGGRGAVRGYYRDQSVIGSIHFETC